MNKGEKDYSKYFITPNLRSAKKRGKEDVQVLQFDPIPEELKTIGYGKRYLVLTYGCQMNEHDSETIAGILEEMGYTATDEESEADIILLNTCAIRENAESRLYLGIHWRFDLEAGIQSGLGIGEFVVDNQLRPLVTQK